MIESLEIAKSRIQIMINKGMDNDAQMLQGLVDRADARIAQIKSGEKPALAPDADAKYAAEVVVDLDLINEPMIADPDVTNADVSNAIRTTPSALCPSTILKRKWTWALSGPAWCIRATSKSSQNAAQHRKRARSVEFNAPLVVTAPTYNIIDELKAEGDWEVLQKYSGFEFDDAAPKTTARTEYENTLYLERPGCNLCMGNQEKAAKGDTVLATSTRLFKGRVVEDTPEKAGESLLASTPVVVLSAILGRTPSVEEYKAAVEGIDLTKFAPPKTTPIDSLSVHY